MPWMQFFDDNDNLLQEYECSRGAKIMMDAGGTIVLDEAAVDTPTNPRVLMLKPGRFAYAKTISDSERDKLRGETPSISEEGVRMTLQRNEDQSSGYPQTAAPTEGLGPEPQT